MSDEFLQPLAHPFAATITPPGSKSLTNRALVLAALAQGDSEISNVLFADDTRVMIDGLKSLGFKLEVDSPTHKIVVHGQAGKIPGHSAQIFCGNSGATIRFLTAVCALGKGEFLLDGVPRMRQRPIGELGDLLHHLGVRIQYVNEHGFPPLKILAHGLPGGLVRFGQAQSSQFLSAVLMVSPYARHEIHIDLLGKQTSWPYVAMTMRLMDHFQITPELHRDPKTDEPRRIVIPRAKYAAADYQVEPDASAAAYFLALAAIHPQSKITIEGLGKQSIQGDVAFADVLGQMGAGLVFGKDFLTLLGPAHLQGIDVDLSAMPDTAQTLAVVALFARGPTTIRGLSTLRVKETDRLAALQTELTKLGASARIEGDSLTIDPPENLRVASIATYDDHRMAMSFALAATKRGGIVIQNPQCVSKTYPNYFEDLRKVLAAPR